MNVPLVAIWSSLLLNRLLIQMWWLMAVHKHENWRNWILSDQIANETSGRWWITGNYRRQTEILYDNAVTFLCALFGFRWDTVVSSKWLWTGQLTGELTAGGRLSRMMHRLQMTINISVLSNAVPSSGSNRLRGLFCLHGAGSSWLVSVSIKLTRACYSIGQADRERQQDSRHSPESINATRWTRLKWWRRNTKTARGKYGHALALPRLCLALYVGRSSTSLWCGWWYRTTLIAGFSNRYCWFTTWHVIP